MSKWIKSGDKVFVTAGNDKGKVGVVLAKSSDRILVEGVNIRKKHIKPQQGKPGRIEEGERTIHISNVRLYAEETPVKFRLRLNAKKEKELVYDHKEKTNVYRNLKKTAKRKK